jgi:parvulin-like peptidyl-prolyl isomerase
VFILGAAALVAAGCRSGTAPAVSEDTWAVVDGRQISREEVERAYRRAQDGQQPLSDEESLAIKLNLLEELIVNEILIARAQALKVEVSEKELDDAFNEARKNIPEEAFQQELTKRNLTVADMRDGLRRDLFAQKLLEQEVTSKVTVTDQDVIAFFNANRAQFNFAEDTFHLAQIVVTPVREPQIANRTGDDAATPQTAQVKAAMLMQRLKEGAAFAQLAMDYSEDPESTPRGGDLGFVPLSALNQAPPALRDVVLNVAPGSARVVTQNGVHTIVYVVAKEAAGQRDLSSPGVRDSITNGLKARREQLLRSAYLAEARSGADITNYLAQRLVENQGKLSAPPSAPPSGS